MNADESNPSLEQRISKLETEVQNLKSLMVERPGRQDKQTPPGSTDSEGIDVPAKLKPKLKDKLPEELAELEEAIKEYGRARGHHELNVAWRSVMDELADVANCAVSAGDDAALDAAIKHVASSCHVIEDSLRKSLANITKAKRMVVDLRPHEEEDGKPVDDDTGEEELA